MSEVLRVKPLGDSITLGQVNSLPVSAYVGYRRPLDELLAAAGISVVFVGSQENGPSDWANRRHEGHGGYSTLMLLQRVPGWIATDQPKIILLLAGAPDRVEPITAEQFANRYRALLLTIHLADPSIKTIASSLTPCSDPPVAVANAAPFNAAIPTIVAERLAAGQRVRYADIGGRLTLSQIADGIHPTPEGYAMLADGWAAAVLSSPILEAPL